MWMDAANPLCGSKPVSKKPGASARRLIDSAAIMFSRYSVQGRLNGGEPFALAKLVAPDGKRQEVRLGSSPDYRSFKK